VRPVARTPEELLQRARDRAEPDAGEAGRVRARLRAQISAGTAGGDLPLAAPAALLRGGPEALRDRTPARLAPALRRTLLGAAGVVLFGGGFVLGRLSSAPSDATARSVASTLSAPDVAVTAPLRAAMQPASAPAASNASPAEPSTPEPRALPRAVPPRAVPPRSARPHTPVTGQPTNEPLKEALRRLRRAQRALYDNDAARALAVLDELDRRIAPAVLGEEREMTRILALCGTGELAEARALAQRWVAEHPQSIYLARLHDSCVEPAEARGTQ
jgi:hypothetical protein